MASSRWSLRNIYLYLVCLITLIMVIVSVVGLVRSTVELVYPDPGYYYYDVPKAEGGTSERTQEDIDAERESQEAQSRRYAILELVGNAAMLLVAGPLYLYHWKKIEVEHAEVPEVAPTLPAA